MEKVTEYENAQAKWDLLMRDEAANALALNSLGQDLDIMRQELEAEGLLQPSPPTPEPIPPPED